MPRVLGVRREFTAVALDLIRGRKRIGPVAFSGKALHCKAPTDRPRDIMRIVNGDRPPDTRWKEEPAGMLITGLALLAAAIGGPWLALPRNSQVQGFVGNDFVEHVVALSITASGAVDLILFLVGLTER